MSLVAEPKYKPQITADRPLIGPIVLRVADLIPNLIFHNWVILLDPPV